jgi:hypothetical protein
MNKGKSHKRAPSLTRALNHSIDPAVITQDTKVRLAKAAELAFPERLNQSELAAHGSAARQSCNLDRPYKRRSPPIAAPLGNGSGPRGASRGACQPRRGLLPASGC